MQYSTSQLSRRIVGRFERGDRLPEALVELCRKERVEAGQVRVAGVLSQIDLALFSIDDGEYRKVFASDGAFELLSFRGIVSMLGPELLLNAHVLVAYPCHGQSHVVGGQLRSATVHAVEFVIDAFEDLQLTRALDPATRLPRLEATACEVEAPAAPAAPRPEAAAAVPKAAPARREIPAPPPTRESAPQPSVVPEKPVEEPPRPVATQNEWMKAAQKSRQMLADKDDESEFVELEPGDVLLHPRLGECTVLRVDDDTAAYIRIKKSRRISKLALSVVRLELVDETDDGKRVFEVQAGAG